MQPMRVTNPYAKQIAAARQAGYSDDEINQFLEQRMPAPAPAATTTQPTRGRGGTLTSLISEGGALGGAAAGAAIGSVVPVVGTAIGGIIGGGLGAFGGRLAENKVRDDRLGVGDAAKEGVLSAVLAGPLKLGKYAGTAAKNVGKVGLNEALEMGAKKAAGPSAIKTALAGRATGAADDMAARALALTKGQKNKILDKTGERAGSIARKYGVDSAEDLPKIIQPLQDEFNLVVDTIPKTFSKNEVRQAFAKAYAPYLKKGTPTGKRAIGERLKTETDSILDGVADEITPSQMNALRIDFDDLAYKLRATDPSAADVNKMSRDVLANLIREAADDAGIKTSNGLTLRQAGQELSKLRRLAGEANKNIEGSGGVTAGSLGNTPGAVVGSTLGFPGAVAGYTINAAANSRPGRRAILGAADKMVKKADSAVAKSGDVRTNVSDIARNLLLANAAGAAIGQVGGGQSSLGKNMEQSTNIATMTTQAPINANIIPTSYSNSSNPSIAEPETLESALGAYDPRFAPQNIQAILAQGGNMDDVGEYLGIVKTLQSFQPKPTTPKAAGSEQVKLSNNARSGLNDIDLIRRSLSADPQAAMKAALPGGGITQSLTGTSGYVAARENVADVIGRLRSGGAINDDEAKRFIGLLPGSFDSPEVAEQKLGRLESLLSSFLVEDTATPSTIEDVLASYTY